MIRRGTNPVRLRRECEADPCYRCGKPTGPGWSLLGDWQRGGGDRASGWTSRTQFCAVALCRDCWVLLGDFLGLDREEGVA